MTGEETEGYASPACSLHEVDASYSGLPAPAPADVQAWRKLERARLIAWRMALPLAERAALTRGIVAGLDGLFADLPVREGSIVSAYWPFRGEPDLRPWLVSLIERGWRAALPLVVAKAAPLAFRPWSLGVPLTRGVWDIPVPAEGEYVVPDVLVAPLVGFDGAGFRLGYGGGFYDRTLAAIGTARIAIGVGYAGSALPTIHPQPHDVRMDWIVTEQATRRRP